MDEEITELVTKAGDKVLAYLEGTEGFVAEQAPLLAQEIISYGIWSHTLYAALFLFLVGACTVFFRKVLREAIRQNDSDIYGVALLVGALDFIFIGITVRHIFDVVKATVAPRLYLLEQIGSLIN